MAELRTRRPTGRVQSPLILVEGEDKGGKSFALAQLAASPRVGRCFYLDIGDGTLDEYAPLGDYELLVHDGTWSSIMEQIEAACAVPSDPDRPNVVGVDTGTVLWNLIKMWLDRRARGRRKNQEILREDPDAEIDITQDLWNDGKARWAKLMQTLKMFPGIGVITAVGREVSKVENGVPVAGQTEWSIDVEKTTTSWVSGWVRMRRPHKATLMGVRKLALEVPRNGLELPDEHMLDHLIFSVLGAGTESSNEGFVAPTAVQPEIGVSIGRAKARVLDAVKRAYEGLTDEEVKAEAGRLWAAYGMPSGQGEVHQDRLTALLLDIAEGRTKEGPPPEPGADSEDDPPPPPPPDEEAGTEPEKDDVAPDADGVPGTTTVPEYLASLGPDEAIAHIRKMKKADLVPELVRLERPTSGKLTDLQDRLIEALGLLEAPFGGQEPKAEPEPIPDGWRQATCLCGEPMAYEPGNATATGRHLDARLDDDHKADEAF